MKQGDPVQFACQEVVILDYLHKEHMAVVTPNHLSAGAINNNIIWGSKLYISGNLLGFEYTKYEDNVIVDKYGIDYLQRFVPKTGMFKYERIKSRIPKTTTQYSFEECAIPLYDILIAIDEARVYTTSHLSGIIYDNCDDPEKILVQSNEALIYSINRRYILPI